MWRMPDPRFDVASALDQGGRDYQEDALITDFPVGDDCGIVVLADGMGGHAAGDLAAKIVVTEVFAELKFNFDDFVDEEHNVPRLMREAAHGANQCVGHHVQLNPEAAGMGATLIALVAVGPNLYWTSIGDSPLYLYRDERLVQLNEDHSLAPRIDQMALEGRMSEEEARYHPDRNCLTSAIIGNQIARIDSPNRAHRLRRNDIVIVSSDGLQFLEDDAIADVLRGNRHRNAREIATLLLHAVKDLDDPDQDNISFAVMKVANDAPVSQESAPPVEVPHTVFASTRLADRDVIDSVQDKLAKLPDSNATPSPLVLAEQQRIRARGAS